MDRETPASAEDASHRPSLSVSRIVLPAAPAPLVLRRDRPPPIPELSLDAGDVLRYVGAARRTLRGPLLAQVEGPGDPLASAPVVLRALALVRRHDPDVMVSLVVDGPLVGEYVDELLDLAVHHVVVRMDASTVKTARRVYGRAIYRGDVLVGPDAGRLVLEEGRRAVRLLVSERIPVAIRFTAIPTVNMGELASIAAFAADAGVDRVEVVPHRPLPRAPLEKAGAPTRGELLACGEVVARAWREATPEGVARPPAALSWFDAARVKDVPLSSLDHVDPLSLLPDPDGPTEVEAEILPPRRARLVAVATSDGAFVDRALEDAGQVRLYAVGSDKTRLLGTRALPEEVGRRRDGVGRARDFLLAVAGCHAVVASHFSSRAATLLEAVGIRPYVAVGEIEPVLDRIARGTIRVR
jgi:predicted Fe-Mo cluster-binding NifX family protein